MKNFFFIFVLLGFEGVVPARENNFQADKEAIERAHLTLSSVRKNFRKTLQQAIKEKGLPGAVGDCQLKAPSLGKSNELIEIGRTSHKLRNPVNRPREWVQPLLAEYLKTPVSQQPKERLVQLGPNHFGYVEPIYVETVCLNCHGADLKADVKKEISQIYPADQAIGFQAGDFRGLIWLESHTK